MWLFVYVFVGFVIAAMIALLLPRKICIWLAVLALILGVAIPVLAWGYAELFVRSDPSAYGMIGTILAVLFAPAGLLLGILAMFKSR